MPSSYVSNKFNAGYMLTGGEAREQANIDTPEHVLHIVLGAHKGYPFLGVSGRVTISDPVWHAEIVIYKGMSVMELSNCIKASLKGDQTTGIDRDDKEVITALWWNAENVHEESYAGDSDEDHIRPEDFIKHKEITRGRSRSKSPKSKKTRSKSPKSKKGKSRSRSPKGKSATSRSRSPKMKSSLPYKETKKTKVSQIKNAKAVKAGHNEQLDKELDDDVLDKDGCWILLPLSSILTRPERYTRRPGFWIEMNTRIAETMKQVKAAKALQSELKAAWLRRTAPEEEGNAIVNALTLADDSSEGSFDHDSKSTNQIRAELMAAHESLQRIQRKLRSQRKMHRSGTFWVTYPLAVGRSRELKWLAEKGRRKKKRVSRKVDMLLHMWLGYIFIFSLVWLITGWMSIAIVVASAILYQFYKQVYCPMANPFNSSTDEWALKKFSAVERLRSIMIPDESPVHGWQTEDREAYFDQVLAYAAMYRRPIWKQTPFWDAITKLQLYIAILGTPLAITWLYLSGTLTEPMNNPVGWFVIKFVYVVVGYCIESPLRMVYRGIYYPDLLVSSDQTIDTNLMPHICEKLAPGQSLGKQFWSQNLELCDTFYCSSENDFIRKMVKNGVIIVINHKEPLK